MEITELTGQIVDAAFRSHKDVGPGLLESVVSEVILADRLRTAGLSVDRQRPIPIRLDGKTFAGEILKGNVERVVLGEVPDLKISESSVHSV